MNISLLRWSIAVVLGSGAVGLLGSLAHAHPGVPVPIVAGLGGTELIGAVLLVVPRTTRLGGLTLLAVLAGAAVLHGIGGELPPASFVVYAAAIGVVMTARAS